MNRLLTVVLVLMTVAGCASWRTREPVPPPPRETWHGPLAMIAFADPTDPVRGEQLAARFWSEAEPRLATAISAVIRRTGPRLAASWLKERATAYRVGAFVTGRIGGVRVQTREHRLWMSLTVWIDSRSRKIMPARNTVAKSGIT